jgi:hypothetical protein
VKDIGIMTMMKKKTNNSNKDQKYFIHLDCGHKHIVDASFVVKPAKHDLQGNRYYLCRDCYTRDRGSCSIHPVHEAWDIRVLD